jgi:lipoprotein-releasing system ATP-binding protein
MSGPTPVLVADLLSKSYSEGDLVTHVFADLDLTVESGERLAIIGASGAGKSTLLHLLGGLDRPTAGAVWVAGMDLAKTGERQRGELRNQHLGFIYQFHHLLPEFTAVENVAIPLLLRGVAPKTAAAGAIALLERVGLGPRLKHRPSELSGGERQRCAVARALVTRPAALLADEPTGNLDEKTAASVFELMLELNRDMGTALVIVTHDLKLAHRMDRVLELSGGKLRALQSQATVSVSPG